VNHETRCISRTRERRHAPLVRAFWQAVAKQPAGSQGCDRGSAAPV